MTDYENSGIVEQQRNGDHFFFYIFYLDFLMDSGQVMEKRSVSVGFALPAKKMIRLLPGSTLASVRAPPNGSTRSIQLT